MKTELRPLGALHLDPCTYGLSRVQFRGPRRPTDGNFAAFLGGSDTFGRYIPKPFPELIETAIGEICVNLGCQSAGPDVFLQDTAIQSICHDATVTVIQLLSAANLSNAFYKVHPRRNDRFIAPTEALIRLYPEVDFTEIAFAGHLIAKLRATDEGRFEEVQQVLQATWLRRMEALIDLCSGPVVLLWLANRAPEEPSGPTATPTNDPLFVTRPMVEKLRAQVADVVEVVAEHGDTQGMCFAPMHALTAKDTMGIPAHQATAKALRTPVQTAML